MSSAESPSEFSENTESAPAFDAPKLRDVGREPGSTQKQHHEGSMGPAKNQKQPETHV